MAVIIGLCILGIALIALEVFVPGGILGFMGIAVIIGATVMAFNEYQTQGAMATFVGALVICSVVLLVELKYLPNTKHGRRMMLMETIKGTSQNEIASESIIGKKGHALTRLNPTGVISVEDKEYECFCEDGMVDKGEKLEVVKRESFRLVVRKAG